MFSDVAFIRILGTQLEGFTSNGATTYNFRCPICGDSQKSKSKKRGYIYEDSGRYYFKCWNCNESLSFKNFLKRVSPPLYSDYVKETLAGSNVPTHPTREVMDVKVDAASEFKRRLHDKILEVCEPATGDHDGYRYLLGRGLSDNQMRDLYFVDNINKITKQIEKYASRDYSDNLCAVVLPFRDVGGAITHIQLRILNGGENFRYLTLTLDESKPKFFGLDRADFKQTVYITEGGFDSLFVRNGISVNHGALTSCVSEIKKHTSNFVLVYDMDYLTNLQINRDLVKAIECDYRVVVYDRATLNRTVKGKQVKDLNDLSNSGMDDVTAYLQKRTFRSIQAKVELSLTSPLNKNKTRMV